MILNTAEKFTRRSQYAALVRELVNVPAARIDTVKHVGGVESVTMVGPFFNVVATMTAHRAHIGMCITFTLDDGQTSWFHGVEPTWDAARRTVDLETRYLIALWSVVRQRVALAHGIERRKLAAAAHAYVEQSPTGRTLRDVSPRLANMPRGTR